jgi:hypothetical protein
MNQLQSVSAEMLRIERINMAYNEATDFGNKPNGQEAEIDKLLAQWDRLHLLRNELKYGHKYGPEIKAVYLPSAQMDMESIFAPSDDENHPNY